MIQKKNNKRESVTWVEVDLGAIQHNIREFKRLTDGLDLMPVVKANAYGHGLVPVAQACEAIGVEYIGVVNIPEALKLRKAGITTPIFVLTYVGTFLSRDLVREAVSHDVELAVFDKEAAHLIDGIAGELGKKARVHVKIDTGTTRVGVFPEDFENFYAELKDMKNIDVYGVFTHFAKAEEDPDATQKQTKKMQSVVDFCKGNKVPVKKYHAACSAALISATDSHYNLGRLGIGLYGLWPSPESREAADKKMNLIPALSWYTKVIQVKHVPKGTEIGYGGTYAAPEDIEIAVLATGYADGYDRLFSNKAEVIINGHRAPIRGRVCMNIMMVEVTHIPNVHAGTKATLLGKDGKEEVTAEELGHIAKTINYEIVTRINWTLPRYYKNT